MAVDNPKQPQRGLLKPDAQRPFNPNQNKQFRTNPNEWHGGGIVSTLEEGSHARSEDAGATPAASTILPFSETAEQFLCRLHGLSPLFVSATV